LARAKMPPLKDGPGAMRRGQASKMFDNVSANVLKHETGCVTFNSVVTREIKHETLPYILKC